METTLTKMYLVSVVPRFGGSSGGAAKTTSSFSSLTLPPEVVEGLDEEDALYNVTTVELSFFSSDRSSSLGMFASMSE